MKDQKILHVDGDAFFASVERAQYPHLRNKPVVVGAERGIATAATYEAKKMGVHRGMPIWEVRKRFPEITILPTHFELYEMYAHKLYGLLKKFSQRVERYSIDECFAMVGEREIEKFGGFEDFLTHIKTEIQTSLGITYSFGLADTKVLAKVASKSQKPDGKTFITEENRRKYLEKLKIGDVWGIGYRSADKFVMEGIKTALQFADLPREKVEKLALPFKEIWNEQNSRRIFGVHDEIKEYSKSLQATRSFVPASDDKALVFSELSKNIETACARLRSERQIARRVWIFLKRSDFRKWGREIILPQPTDDPGAVLDIVRKVFEEIYEYRVKYRTTGVTLFQLLPKESMQSDLFGNLEEKNNKNVSVEVDSIREKFGKDSIFLASSLKSVKRRHCDFSSQHVNDPYIPNLPFPYLGEVW